MNRMRLKKIWVVAFCICICLLIFTGCGSEKSNDESGTEKSPESESKVTDVNETTNEETEADKTTAEETTDNPDGVEPLPMPEIIESWEAIPDTEFSLSSPSTAISLKVKDNALYVMSLKNPDTGYEWIDGESLVNLPEKVALYNANSKKTEDLALNWTFKGAYKNEENGSSLKLTFKNESPAFEIDSIWNVSGSDGPVQHTAYIRNLTEENYIIYPNQSLEINIKSETDPDIWRFHKESGHADSTGVYISKITPKNAMSINTSTHNDSMASGFIPCAFYDSGTHGLYVAYEWAQGCIMSYINADTPSIMGITAGFDFNFKTVLNAGESFYVPTAYLGAYSGDVDSGSNIFKRWFFETKVPDRLRENEAEPYTQLDDQGLFTTHDLLSMGVQSLKWDYGIGKTETMENGWGNNEGTWKVLNPVYLNHLAVQGYDGITDYGAAIREKGLNFTVYLLLHDSESTDPDVLTSIGENGHPEWFGNRRITTGLSADLGNTDCVDWIKVNLLSFLEKSNVYTWRSDFEPISITSDKINRHVFNNTDTTYWCATGFYEILDYLYEYRDNFRYENCGSGGSMKDYATLSRSMVVQIEDTSRYTDIRTVFYASSYAIHPTQLQAACNPDSFAVNSQYYVGTGDQDFGMRSIIMMAPHIGAWEGTENIDGSNHYMNNLEDYITKYYNMFNEKIKPLMRHGDLYHILPRPDGVNWDGMQYFDKNTENEIKGVVFLFKPTNTEGENKLIKLKGVDENTSYQLTFEDRPEQNGVYTGRQLLDGFNVNIEGDMGSEIIWITIAE